ncbi:MAG: NOL1/NOP2/sun family putative RNA methylase [Archaeoglobus sp.]|nr:NOL1/NOP2/sun family putative RNA methylase [Archaeoglobus sp.]
MNPGKSEVLDFPSTNFSKKVSEEFGYDEFIVRRWERFFGREQTLKLIEAMESVPKYLRVNTLKVKEKDLIKRMEKRGFRLEKTEVDFCYEILEERYSAGATPEYLMGYYYLMDKSSCIPPLVLDPKGKDVVIDFAASPGGKTTMLAQLMENRGVILALEVNRERIRALRDNIQRMGVINTAILKMDASVFHRTGIKADKILLDAPCTGEGIIHKDPSRKVSRGEKDIQFCSGLQKKMIFSAIESLKENGVLVYSTCSLTPEENEFVINDLLDYCEEKGIGVEMEEIPFGEEALMLPGIKEEVKLARRFYPHIHRCSGFFVAKLRRV